MISLPFRVLKAEKNQKVPITRQPEPALVMDSADQVAAFHKASEWGGVMDSLHVFMLCNLVTMVRRGDNVIDLACGPADYLIKAAALLPNATFTGMDLSDEMLTIARARCEAQNIKNVKFIKGDMTKPNGLSLKSFDVVMSTMAVHHLPNLESFNRFHANVAQLVKKDGSILIVDFARLKSEKTIKIFADDMQKRTPTLMVRDYIYSMEAAFAKEDFEEQANTRPDLKLSVTGTYLFDYLVVLRTPARVSFFKQPSIWKLPIHKINLKTWGDYFLLKLFCTKKSKPKMTFTTDEIVIDRN